MPPHFRILSQTVYARTAQKVNHMKLLVLSDTHRSLGFAYEAIETESPDAVAHLGDHLSDAEDLSFAFQEPEFFYVTGNCDYEPAARQSLLLELAGVRIFLTHGHLFGVKSGLDTLAAAAKDMGAQLALFGHTHQALLEERNGVTLLNPGAAGRFGRSSYAVVELENGKFSCQLKTEQ